MIKFGYYILFEILTAFANEITFTIFEFTNRIK